MTFSRTALVSTLVLSLVGCVEAPDDPAVDIEALVADGSPEAQGILGIANDGAFTAARFVAEVGLTTSPAQALVAHRDGPDGKPKTTDDHPFRTVAELAAVKGIGKVTIDRLLTFAGAHGYVPKGSDVLGVWDGVTFTVDEAAATVKYANAAAAAALQTAGVTATTAKAIIAARPFPTVAKLAAVSGVGTATLDKIKHAATAGAPQPPSAQVAADLTTAVKDLTYPSESDFPFDVVRLVGAGKTAVTVDTIKTVVAPVYVQRAYELPLADRFVETRTTAQLFDPITTEQSYWDALQKAAAVKYRALRAILEGELTNVQVFRLGEHRSPQGTISGAVDIYVIGVSVEGDLVGVHTVSIET
jgi:DNA uptake protein ComE-like DNA-binding protein